MAGSSRYQDDDDAGAITDINVTPFVDVVLVLLVVFIVTAKLIVARGIEVDLPKAASGGDVQSALRVAIDEHGTLTVNTHTVTGDADAIAQIQHEAARSAKPKAIIAGNRQGKYDLVMHAIDLVHRAGVTAIALENVRP
jgi:biopolymer transport protein TolR